MLLLVALAMFHISQNKMALKDFFGAKQTKAASLSGSIGSYAPTQIKKPKNYLKPEQFHIKDRDVQVGADEFDELRPLVYGEVSNRSPDKQALEANVIFNTAINRMRAHRDRGTQKTLIDIISEPNQYQAYQGNQYKAYSSPPDVVAAAKRKQVDAIMDNIREQIRNGTFVDNTNGAYYYVHEKDGRIIYDDQRPLFAQ